MLGAEAMSLEILKRNRLRIPDFWSFLDYSSPRMVAVALQRSEPGKDAVKAPIVADTKTRPPIFVVHVQAGLYDAQRR